MAECDYAEGLRCQVRNSWKLSRKLIAYCGLAIVLLAFGACSLPLSTSVGNQPTATVVPTLPPTPTSAQIQAAVKMNRFTLVSAVAIAQSGKIFDGSNAFLDADGNAIPSGKYLGSAIVNARYVGQLITNDQLTNPTSQPDFLFAVYNARHEVVFINIQTFSQVRDGKVFSQLKKKDPDGITVADMNFIWATEPYDPRQTIGTHGEPYESITTLTSVFGLSQDQFYNIAVATGSAAETPKWDGSDSLHQKFAQGISFYNYGPVSDSVPVATQTVAALENRPYTGAIALLTLGEIQALLRLSTVPPTQTTIAPAAIERGN